jgi:uncharacterized protein RhaS with RHS repeats
MYLSQDPIGLGGGFHFYSYVSNPNSWIDIFGLKGKNPTVTRGSHGEPLSASVTVTPQDIKNGGSGTNASSREFSEKLGNNQGDDAGHILGKKLGGQGGKDNVFPQNPSVNRGQYRRFEQSLAEDIRKNGAADITWRFHYGDTKNPARPTKVEYVVSRNGNIVDSKTFKNTCP